jgi:hypothetical protein
LFMVLWIWNDIAVIADTLVKYGSSKVSLSSLVVGGSKS